MNISENDNDLILELATLLFQDKISSGQREALGTLLDKNEGNRIYFKEIRDSWVATALYQDNKVSADTEVTWNSISSKLARSSEQKAQETAAKSNIFFKMSRIAALWLLLIFTGGAVSWFIFNRPLEKRKTGVFEITTPLGSRSFVKLPDGSNVWLNAGSRIRYTRNSFRDDRIVYLEGEAYFDVSKRHGDLFIVKTSDISIKVYGTKFNVRSYPEENEIHTTLIEGSVAIESKRPGDTEKLLFLKPNQTATYYKKVGKKPEDAVNDDIAAKKEKDIGIPLESIIINPEPEPIVKTSWKDDHWIIMAKGFDDLAVELERRYKVNIQFKDESLKNYKFSGTLADETFDQVMKIIQLSAPVRFRYTIANNNVTLQYDDNNTPNH